ncbi:MAG: arginine N-succinyltransferase, partial [Phycisphaeraceae bacterium]
MLLIRPVSLADVDDLLTLAHHTGFGLTTLPRDRAMLERRVRDSQRGFAKRDTDPPGGEAYLFVMEDTETHAIVGTSGMVSKVGGFEPFYAYRIETSVHESPTLGVRKEIRTLHLLVDHNGPCEIGSLFLHPDHRRGGNGRALSLVR